MDLEGVNEEQITFEQDVNLSETSPTQLDEHDDKIEKSLLLNSSVMDHNGQQEHQEQMESDSVAETTPVLEKEETAGGAEKENAETKPDEDPLKKLKSLKFKPMVRRPQASKKPETPKLQRPSQAPPEGAIRKISPPPRDALSRKEEGEESSASELEEVRPKRERVERSDEERERPRKRKYDDDGQNDDRRREKRERDPPRRSINPQTFKKRIDMLSREECKVGLADDGELRRLIEVCCELEFEQDYTLTTRIKLKDELMSIRSDEDHRIRRSIDTKPAHLQKVASDQYEELMRKQRGFANLHAMLANPMSILMGGPMPVGLSGPPPGPPLTSAPPPFIPPMFTGPPPNTQLPPSIPPPTNGPPIPIIEPANASTSNPPAAATSAPPPLDFSKPPPSFSVPPPTVPPSAPETKSAPPVSVANDFSQPPPKLQTDISQPPPPVPTAGPPSEMPNMNVPPPTLQKTVTSKPSATSSVQAESNPWKMENAVNTTTASAPYSSSQDREFGPISTPSASTNLLTSTLPQPPQSNGLQPTSGANIATMLTNLIASSIRMGNAGGSMMGSSPNRTGMVSSPQKPFGSPQRPPKRASSGRPMKKNSDRERTDSNSSGPAAAEV